MWGFCDFSRRYLGCGAPTDNCPAYRNGEIGRGDCRREDCTFYEDRENRKPNKAKGVAQ